MSYAAEGYVHLCKALLLLMAERVYLCRWIRMGIVGFCATVNSTFWLSSRYSGDCFLITLQALHFCSVCLSVNMCYFIIKQKKRKAVSYGLQISGSDCKVWFCRFVSIFFENKMKWYHIKGKLAYIFHLKYFCLRTFSYNWSLEPHLCEGTGITVREQSP